MTLFNNAPDCRLVKAEQPGLQLFLHGIGPHLHLGF